MLLGSLSCLEWFRTEEHVETLRAVNNSLSVTAALLFACALLTGGRSWDGVALGRFFGLTALGWAVLHLFATLLLQRYYPFFGWYAGHLPAMLAGLAALGVFTALMRLSFRSGSGRARFGLLAPLGYVLALTHILLVDGVEWMSWFLVDPLSWPPPALTTFVCLLVALLLRSKMLGRLLPSEPAAPRGAGRDESVEESRRRRLGGQLRTRGLPAKHATPQAFPD